MQKKADSILVCVFVQKSYNDVFEYDINNQLQGLNLGVLNNYEYNAFQAAEIAANEVKKDYPSAQITVHICPYDLDNNIVIIEKNKFGQNLPAILITGYYENTQRVYPIANYPGGLRDFDKQEIYDKIRALYENKFGTGQPLICKLLPPLCSLGAYAWLALLGVSAYKTVEQKNNPTLQVLWGASTLFAADAFFKKGGFKVFRKKL